MLPRHAWARGHKPEEPPPPVPTPAPTPTPTPPPPSPAPGAPQWQNVPTVTFIAGQISSFNYASFASDPEGDPLTFSSNNLTLPTGVTHNEAAKLFAFNGSPLTGAVDGNILYADDAQPNPFQISDIIGPSSSEWEAPDPTHWNKRLYCSWTTPGQIDFSGNSGSPWATNSVTANGNRTFDVLALVQRWVSGYNRGILLVSTSGSATFAGRTSGTPPQLDVNTSAGNFTLRPCTATAAVDMSTFALLDGRNSFTVDSSNRKGFVQFDISAIPKTATVTSATMTLNCTARTGTPLVQVWELNHRRVYNGARVLPTPGLAAAFVKDTNITSHPAVYFSAKNMQNPSSAWNGRTISLPNTEYIYNATFDATIARCRIPAGQQEIDIHEKYIMFGGATDNSLPLATIDEAYGRYYVMFESDWIGADGGKMPGWDTRQGFWKPGSHQNGQYPNGFWDWSHAGGNGSVPANGTWVSGTDFNAPGQDGQTTTGFHGQMLRGSWSINSATPSQVPYGAYMRPGLYMYHLDQGSMPIDEGVSGGGSFGDIFYFQGRFMRKNQWYCIEHRVRMNSLTGTADADGNRTAVADGLYQCWLDGELVHTQTNMRWRRHPNIGLASWWIGFFHGGGAVAPADMHVQVRNVVLASQYIGMMG